MWGVLGEFGPVTPSPGNKALTMMWLLGVYEPPPRKHSIFTGFCPLQQKSNKKEDTPSMS